MPVSDTKKIARLFKDKTISAGTKDKLLYKTGWELLETWSVFEQNKAERAKPAEPLQNDQPAKDAPTPKSKKAAPIVDKLQRLLASLPAPIPLTPAIIQSQADILTEDRERFLGELNALIENLESHLRDWKSVRDLAQAASEASD